MKAYSYRRQKLDIKKCPVCDIAFQTDEYFIYHYYFTHKEGREED